MNKELTVQEQAKAYMRKWVKENSPSVHQGAYDREKIVTHFLAGHSLANDRIKELEEQLSSLKASMDILVDDNERLRKRGMRWVKASERLPKLPNSIPEVKGYSEEVFAKYMGQKVNGRFYRFNNRIIFEFIHITGFGSTEDLEDILWNDESESIISKGEEWMPNWNDPEYLKKMKETIKELADWSRKYPRERIYSTSRQPQMDGELIAIEEKAKSLIPFPTPPSK